MKKKENALRRTILEKMIEEKDPIILRQLKIFSLQLVHCDAKFKVNGLNLDYEMIFNVSFLFLVF